MDMVALRAMISRHEGRKARAYEDSKDILTVGVGFNLARPDAGGAIAALGVDYGALCTGAVELSESQIDQLLDGDIAHAVASARTCVSNFASLPEAAQRVVVDMVFNLGAAGFAEFKRTIGALERNDLRAAADEMKDSAWYREVATRGVDDVAIMMAAASAQGPAATA